MALIGQFGVGFYSAFMVSDEGRGPVAQGRARRRPGAGSRTARASSRSSRRRSASRGTTITLHLFPEADAEYAERPRLAQHRQDLFRPHRAADRARGARQGGRRSIPRRRSGRALSAEITDEQYREFYHHVAHSFDEPWLTLHAKAEGTLRIHELLFVPATKPFDLFDPRARTGSSSMCGASSSPMTARSCCRPICASCAASSIQRGSAAQCQPRDAAEEPDAGADARPDRAARPRRAREEGEGRARGIREVLGEFRRRAQRGALRGRRASRAAARRSSRFRSRRATGSSRSRTMSRA